MQMKCIKTSLFVQRLIARWFPTSEMVYKSIQNWDGALRLLVFVTTKKVMNSLI